MRQILKAMFCTGMLLLSVSAMKAGEVKSFKYETISTIAPVDLWHSTQRQVLGNGASVLYFEFDRESAPEKDGWTAQGLILGGLGDLDSKPLAIRLWSKLPSHLDIDASKKLSDQRNAAVAIFVADPPNGCPQAGSCPQKRLEFSVSADGKVSINSKSIATVE